MNLPAGNRDKLSMNDSERKKAVEALLCSVFIRLLEVARREGITVKRMRELLPAAQLQALEDAGFSKSEIMADSGYTRQWIRQILGKPMLEDDTNFLDRFVSNWDADPEFPDTVSLSKQYPSFDDVFDRYGGDFTAPALLKILKNRQIVTVKNRMVTLCRTRDVTASAGVDMIRAASCSLSALLDTLNHNLAGNSPPFTERRIWSDHIPKEKVGELREAVRALNTQHYANVLDILAEYQVGPDSDRECLNAVGVGIYWFESDA